MAAWHPISPCLLTGLGIYCNAIVLVGIGPVLSLMMPSIEIEVIIAQLEARHGDGQAWSMEEGEELKVREHTSSISSDTVKTICMLVFGVGLTD